MKNIKLAIADYHPLFRRGLIYEIEEWKDTELIIEAANGKELIAGIKKRKPDLVLTGLKMPVMDGIKAITYIKKHYPNIKIIVLTMYSGNFTIAHMMKLDVNAYLIKSVSGKEVRKAVQAVMSTGFYYSKQISRAMQNGLAGIKSIKPGFDFNPNLTQLELKVLKFICEGLTTAQIAKKMYLSARTIESYRYNLLDKADVKNTAGLVKYAIENSLVHMDLRAKGTG